MGTTTSSAHRDSRGEEDAAAEELSAAGSDARDDGSADDKLLQNNGQISILNVKTRDHADELNGQFEERVLADVGSGFVNVKEDGTETIEDLQDLDCLQPNTKNESGEMVNAGVTLKEETEVENQVNDINEVGFKKIFRFVGFKFTLKKDTCEKGEEDELKEANASEDAQEESDVAAIKATPEETQKNEVSSQLDAAEPPQQTDNEGEPDQDINIVEYHAEETPGKEMEKESTPELEEPMSPIKQFFTQGIFASLRKKKKEEEIQKESKEEEPKGNEYLAVEEAEKEDSKCMCLDIPYIISEEEKDSQEKCDDNLLPVGDLQSSLEKDKVQGSPLKRLFRKFSSRRQRESKAEKVIEEQVSEQLKPSLEVIDLGKAEEPIVGEPKPADDELADVSSQESKKKSDTTVSWEALICGGSAKKKARKTTEDETPGQELEKTTDSPLGSSIEGDYDHLTSSNEQTESPAEGETGSTWKTFKKMVTPKRKVRTGESSTPEQIPSDSEMSKEESFSMRKLISGNKKRKSDRTFSDEAAHGSGEEDDETPAIIPLSEYEVIEPEVLKELIEQRVEIIIEHEMPEMTSQVLVQETSKIVPKVPSNTAPKIIHSLSEEFEELTDFLSKHQQLSDIPEEGIIEESIETPGSSAEWTTQDDTLAEDIVELTADAVTAPEPQSEEFTEDDTTEMVSALSQLTESARSSGHVTPVPAEHDVQTSDVILQEAIQSICMTPSVQSVTTKDESHKSLAVSFSPYIVQSSTPEQTKVLVAHKKTEATSICIGLVSQEMEPVEEHLPAPLVEPIPEVSDAVPTELLSDNFTDECEVAGLGIDEVFDAEIKDVKTEYHEIIVNEEETATEGERGTGQDVQLVTEPLVDESKDKKEETTTSTELPNTQADESACNQPLAAELTQAMHTGEVEQEILDITEKPTTDFPVVDKASAVECLEVSITPISDPVKPETTVLEDSLHIEDVQSLPAEGESGDGKVAQQEIKEIHVQEEIRDVVSSEVKAENISETVDELLVNETLPAKETLLIEPVLEDVHKEIVDTDLGDKVEDNASDTSDRILAKEELKEGQPLMDTKSDENENQDADLNNTDTCPDITLGETEKGEMVEEIREQTIVPEFPKDVSEPMEEPTEPEVRREVIPTPTAKTVPTEIVALQTEEWSEGTKQNEQPMTSENSKTGKVLEMVAIIENTTRESEQENVIVANLEAQELTISELPKAPEQEADASEMTVVHGEAKDGDQAPVVTSTEKSSEKDTILEPEGVDSVSEEVAVTILAKNDAATQMEVSNVSEQKNEADEDATQKIGELKEMALSKEVDTKDKELAVTEVVPPAQVPPLSTEVTADMPDVTVSEVQTQVVSELRAATLEVTEPKVEMPVVTEVKVETAVVTDLEVERPVVTSVVTELEVETPVVTSTAKTTDAYNSQNIKANTSHMTEKPIVISVVVTPATPLDEATPFITQSNESMVVVEDTSVGTGAPETPKVESVIVRTIVAPSVEIQNVTPVIAIPSSVIVTEGSSPVVVEAAVGHTLVEATVVETTLVTAVKPTVVEIPVVQTPDVGAVTMSSAVTSVPPKEVTLDVTLIAETPLNKGIETPVESVKPTVAAVTQTTIAEKPAVIPVTITEAACPVVATPVVTPVASERMLMSAVESPTSTPTQISVTVTKAEAPITTSAATSAVIPVVETVRVIETPVTSVTAAVETPTTIPVVQTPVVKLSSVAEVETPVVTPLVKTPGEVSETAPSAVVSSEETPPVIPAEESPVAILEAPVVSLMVQTPCQGSVRVTETSPPEVVSGITVTGKTLVQVTQVEQTPFVKTTEVAVVEAPVVTPVEQTQAQGSVTVTETAPPAVVLAVETPPVMPVVQTPVPQPTQVEVVEAPVVIPLVQTPGQGSVTVTETAPPAISSAVETPPVSVAVVTPIVNLTHIGVVDAHTVPPVVQTQGQGSVIVTETSSPAVVSGLTATVGTPTVIPVVETPAVVEAPVVPPVVQTQGQGSVTVTETSSPAIVAGVTATVGTPTVILVVETPAVVEAPVVPPVVQTQGQGSVTVTETSSPAIVAGVMATVGTPTVIPVVETPAVVEAPVVPPVVQTQGQGSVTVTETSSPAVVAGVTATVGTPTAIRVVETPAVVEAPVVPPVVQTQGQGSVTVTETSSTAVVAGVTATVGTPTAIPVVETPAVVEAPVVPSVVQTPGQGSIIITETSSPAVVSGVTATEGTPTAILVVETPAVVEAPVVPPVVQTPGQGSVTVTETSSPAVVSGVTATVETPTVMPVVETPVVKSTPVAVVEVPVVTPTVQAPGQVSEIVKETTPPVLVSAVEVHPMIPFAETPVVMSTPVAVVEVPVVPPVVQTPDQGSVGVTETAPVETPTVIPVVETPPVKSTPIAVVEIPVVTPVVQTPGQASVIVKETAPLAVVSAVQTASDVPVVATPVVTSTHVAVVEVPAVTPVKQTPCQGAVRVTETAPPVLVSSVETPLMMPGVETPVAVVEVPVVTPVVQAPGQVLVIVKETGSPAVPSVIPAAETPVVTSTPVSVLEVPAVTPVVQTPGQGSVKPTETSPPAATAAVETPALIPAVETPVVKSAPVAVVEAPVVSPVKQTSETVPPAVTAGVETTVLKSAPVAVVETPVVTSVVQTPVKSSTATVETPTVTPVVVNPTPVAVLEAPILTPVVQISGQGFMRVTETSSTAVVETPVLTPVVETPAAVVETPVLTPVVETPVLKPMVQTTRQVLVTLTETAPAVVVSAAAEKPVGIPVEPTELKPTPVAETPLVTPVMMTSTVTSIAERSVVSLVLETTAPTTIAVTERPIMIPVVQTPALVSVIVKETAPPVVLPPGAEILVKSPIVETLAVKPAVHASEASVGELAEQTPAGIESEEKAQVAETLAVAPVMVTPAMAPVGEAPAKAPPVVTQEIKEAILQVVPHDTNEANTESSIEFEDAVQLIVAAKEVHASILTQENAKGSPPHENVVTSEVEEDVWEDAVDNIGDSQCQQTHTDGEPQDTAAKQASDAGI